MIGKTLSLYIAVKFAKNVLFMMIALLFLIVTVDFVEQLRKAAEIDDVSVWSLYLISLYKAPIFLERAFPFGCLFAAMMTLTQLNTKLELVVARAAGISAWQFLLPLGFTSVIIGLFAAMVYNPVAIMSQERSKELTASVYPAKLKAADKAKNGYWIRQDDESGSYVINANFARNRGTLLDDVTIVRWNPDGSMQDRIDAPNAVFRDDHWLLIQTKTTHTDGTVSESGNLRLKTKLHADNLLGASTPPDALSFWELRNAAERVAKSGANHLPYLVQFHGLLSLPFFLVAMVLIAACVSLRFVRFGQVGRMILGGILSGFVLYIVTSLITSMGSNGIVPPAVAAWSPACVAILFGMSILLHQEDG